jgi:nuclear pore complex protein Nup205
MSEDMAKREDMWTPFKELQSVVQTVVSRPVQGVLKQVQGILRKHKQNFITLLKNPPKCAKSREELRKGVTEGISLPGTGHQILPKELLDEVVIISDMYDLNEYMAVDLLSTAQQQLPYYPGLTRGLVAVLLYYDGRKSIAATLRTLVQARRGILWTLDSSEEVVSYITQYTQELMDYGLINKILELLQELDLSKEIELLQQNRALGGPRHHRQVEDLFIGIRQTLADVVYYWAAQCGLPKDPTFKLINHLKATTLEEDATGGIDSVTLSLVMALLYALDLSILQQREDGEQFVQKLPLIAEPDFIRSLIRELSPSGGSWECSGLQALAHLAWGLALATLRLAPTNLHPAEGFIDEDDLFVDAAIDMKVFDYLHHTILENESIYKEEFHVRRLHCLLTDFIVLMPLKLKELRNRADETARTMQVYTHEGLEPPSHLPHHYEHLLITIARLYGSTSSSEHLNLDLELDYWNSADVLPTAATGSTSYHFRSSSRQTSLFKFVSGCADLLPPLLFVPYMKMLCSLASHPQAARHAFNLLKQNVGNSVNVSWDHFFQSLNRYYSNLRQELPPSTDTVYRHRNYPRGITLQEIQGLQAVLAVVRAVAENDEMARIALCDNRNWAPLSVLLGLVSCSVPIPLKAELLLTLAALAKTPSTAATLWHNLEASQILTTVPSTSSYQPRGIKTELEEIESRNEEFPLTRALLHLLDVLTDVPVPRLLGVGTRTPGFDPYLNFIINSVFLRFNNRSYKNPDEKWVVAKSCLRLMAKFLAQYEPQVEDFVGSHVELQGGGIAQVNPHPGYHIMVNFNTKSELLRLVLYLVDEGCHLLDTYSPFPGKESLEDSMLSCLDLLDRALAHQQNFFSFLNNSGCPLLLTGLSKLLLGVNPRSGKPDHLLYVAKYVTYNSWLPHHTLSAVRILLAVATYPTSHSQLISAFTSSPGHRMEIRRGFVDCLDADDDIVSGDDEGEEKSVVGKTKEAILKLLQQCLGHASPNLSHYLFGFELNKDIKKSTFQQAGVMGFPRTCLHSLLAILDSSVTAQTVPFAEVPKPWLLDSAYCMLYSLCANTKTSEPVLRFLRSCNDFLARHLASLPFTSEPQQTSELNQMAWLLKTVAIELKVTATHMHHSQLGNLVNLLVREQGEEMVAVSVEENAPSEVSTIMQLSHYLATPSTFGSTAHHRDPLVLRLLHFLDFSLASVTAPNWEFFEPSQIEQVLIQCEISVVGSGLKLIDMKKLHRILMEEQAAIQGSSSAGQRQLILQEIQAVLLYALKHNAHRTRVGSTVRYMDAWRQVSEVLFAVTPPEILPFELRKQLLLETVRLLLRKGLLQDALPELASLASGVVLLLLVNLRHCLMLKQKEAKFGPVKDHAGSSNSSVTDRLNTHNMPTLQANTATLKVILSNIVEWILKSGIASQQLRANLYGALLNVLHIACVGGALVPEVPGEDLNNRDTVYVKQLDSSRYRADLTEQRSRCLASLEVIVGFGEGLVDVLCHDSTGGHDVCKMLALSCLDKLIELDPHTSWVSFLLSRGYLKHLIDSLLDSERKLLSVLETVPATLRPLYLYESKMALLCRIASTHSGAELLLQLGTFCCLAYMAVFDSHPNIVRSNLRIEMDFIPSVSARYLQILFPALDLCDAVLTSLGTDNQSSTVQILHFILNHSEMVTVVLRAGSPYMQLGHLKELARLTGVIARSSYQDMCHVTANGPQMETSSQLHRIQKLMLALLPRFVVSETLLRELTGSATISAARTQALRGPDVQQTDTAVGEERMEAVLRFFQVACHLVLYARNIVASHGADHRASTVIFKASLAELGMATEQRMREGHMGESTVPNLGVVVQQLVQCVDHHHREKTAPDLLSQKLSSIPDMNSTELKEFLPEGTMNTGNVSENRSLAAQHLTLRVKLKHRELEYCSFLIENCLYLVWCHLDYYMLQSLPHGFPQDVPSHVLNQGIKELVWLASPQEISQLKQGLISIFSDSFSRRLIDTNQDRPASDREYVKALIRRIKRLMQFVPVK